MEDRNETVKTFTCRAALLGLSARRYGEFTLPRSGQTVRFRSLSELEFEAYENAAVGHDEDDKIVIDKETLRNARGLLLVATICNEGGELILTADDLAAVGAIDMDDALPLYEAIRQHCGLAAIVERRKAREALAKN
jgi:hypothetical protein